MTIVTRWSWHEAKQSLICAAAIINAIQLVHCLYVELFTCGTRSYSMS